jgi:uncharacterized membrane protein
MARDRDERRGPRLDQPLALRRSLRPEYDPERFGALSERIARFIGSWRFIAYMTTFIALWFTWNAVGPQQLRFDPYAFLFLTLLLSLQASYAAPLILLAQNRQADRDRVQYEDDRARTERLIAETEYLSRELAALRVAAGDLATRDFLRSELRSLLDDINRDAEAQASPGALPTSTR